MSVYDICPECKTEIWKDLFKGVFVRNGPEDIYPMLTHYIEVLPMIHLRYSNWTCSMRDMYKQLLYQQIFYRQKGKYIALYRCIPTRHAIRKRRWEMLKRVVDY